MQTRRNCNEIDEREIEPGLRSANRAFCLACKSYVRLLTPRETGERYRANWAEFARLADLGIIHRIHDRKGEIKICLNSLERAKLARNYRRFLILKPCGLLEGKNQINTCIEVYEA
jgi:hypothetical protein